MYNDINMSCIRTYINIKMKLFKRELYSMYNDINFVFICSKLQLAEDLGAEPVWVINNGL